ncbi:hypothetical protein BM50_0668 [Streptococcus pneumoniae]|nr:hypothetical protein BM50_0668 [Streptococcus pneumoniae]
MWKSLKITPYSSKLSFSRNKVKPYKRAKNTSLNVHSREMFLLS